MEPSEIFKVLAVDTRIKIIDLLKSKGPLGAKSIAEMLDITPAAVSQHLRVLRQAGLVRSERRGYWIPYSIDREALESCKQMLNEICTCGCRERGNFKGGKLSSLSLEALKRYEKELQNELKAVRARIEEIESQKIK